MQSLNNLTKKRKTDNKSEIKRNFQYNNINIKDNGNPIVINSPPKDNNKVGSNIDLIYWWYYVYVWANFGINNLWFFIKGISI